MPGDNLEVFVYKRNGEKTVPYTVQKLIVKEGVKELPNWLCYRYQHLRQVNLKNGLKNIGQSAFERCYNLAEITICNTVQSIELRAFEECIELAKVEFERSTSTPSMLQRIGEEAFYNCHKLQRIKLPSTVISIGSSVFGWCFELIEANLSTTGVTEIPYRAFYCCTGLQTVSLPNTLERIGLEAFDGCRQLVTVVVSLDSPPIKIGPQSFHGCSRLANLILPKDSTAEEDSFRSCELLHQRYGEDITHIVSGLIGRFEDYPVHRMCYDQKRTSVEELRQWIAGQHDGGPLVDKFGMSPFHILLSTPEPRLQLLKVLLDHYPRQLSSFKDANGKRALDYLITNWEDGTVNLFRPTLQKLILDPLVKWRCKLWLEDMETKVGALLFAAQFKDDKKKRLNALDEIYSAFEQYEKIESISILELALWKCKLKSGRSNDGAKRQALDRVQCRCVCGSDVLIPNVTVFLYG